jgi:AcrR family transcriptional regulator
MPRGRASDYEDQRAHVLARAAECFATLGYAGTSMQQLAQACGLSKATLYHYCTQKEQLLEQIAQAHMQRLLRVVRAPSSPAATPDQHLRGLILGLVNEYADARHAHRVLTEDIKYLQASAREALLAQQREVVDVMAQAVLALRPELHAPALHKPLTMLLFGMVNWMFTWVRPEGPLRHAELAPMVADLFLGGLAAVRPLTGVLPEAHWPSQGS